MIDSPRRSPRGSFLAVVTAAVLSALVVFGTTSLPNPGSVEGATSTKVAACSANLRTRPTTVARVRKMARTGTKVTVVANVTGSRWRVSCAGRSVSGRTWYRISAVNGRSVRSLFGVQYLYAATALFKSPAATAVAPPPPPAAKAVAPPPPPAATPTPPPAATPTPLPTATPPAATCGTSLQTLINGTPTGGTLAVPDCLYRESVTVTRPMTIDGTGATIDGRDAAGTPVRQRWLFVSANDVTVRGFTMQYTSGGYAVGGVETATGVQRFVLQGCDVSHAYVNINLTGTTDSTIRDCAIHDATHLGVRVAANAPHGGQRNQISSNRIYHNNRTGEPDPNADAGGLKATWQDGLTLDGNEVYDNGGAGLWLDAACLNATISNNKVHHNDSAGIMDETSTGTKITGNSAWENGFGPYGAVWGWGAGILIASSKDDQVWGNTVAWNYAGISVISQNRSDSPGLTGTYVHDNLVMAEQPTAGHDRYGLFWGQDWSGPLYAAASNNRGATNKFWYPAAENQYARFIWDGYRNLSSFVTVPGGTGSRWLTDAEKSAALAAGGAPASP